MLVQFVLCNIVYIFVVLFVDDIYVIGVDISVVFGQYYDDLIFLVCKVGFEFFVVIVC